MQELLGHPDVSTTMNVYAHTTWKAKRRSAKLLDKVVRQQQKISLVNAHKGKNKGKYKSFTVWRLENFENKGSS